MINKTHVSGTIKPLVWDHYDCMSWTGKSELPSYGIDRNKITGVYRMDGEHYLTLDAAKAAAQADYEARIRNAALREAVAKVSVKDRRGRPVTSQFHSGTLYGRDQARELILELIQPDAQPVASSEVVAHETPDHVPQADLSDTDEPQGDLVDIAKDSVEILQVAIDNWNKLHPDEPDEIFTDLKSRCRAAIRAQQLLINEMRQKRSCSRNKAIYCHARSAGQRRARSKPAQLMFGVTDVLPMGLCAPKAVRKPCGNVNRPGFVGDHQLK